MKKVCKLLTLGIFLLSFTLNANAQEKHNKKEKKEIREQVHLTKEQKQEMKTFHKSAKKEKKEIANNMTLSDQQKKEQLEKLKVKKNENLEAILTREQKEKMKQLKPASPHRGVTNMPNERKAK